MQRSIKRETVSFKGINPDEKLCGMGCATCNITPYGEVNPCLQMRLNVPVQGRKLWQVWKSNPDLNRARNLSMKDRRGCLVCPDIKYCLFYCPGMALVEDGGIKSRFKEACRIARVIKEVAQ